MNGSPTLSRLVRACHWVARLVAVNALWVLFTLLGLVVVGIMPATAALFAVLRRWAIHEDEVPVLRCFWRAYRAEFRRANVLGYILVGVGYLLYTNYAVARAQDGVGSVMLSVVLVMVAVCYVALLVNLFPTLAHLNLSLTGYLRMALAVGLGQPLLTVCAVVGVAGIVIAAGVWAPFVLLMLGVSLPAWIATWCAHRVFGRMQLVTRTSPATGTDLGPRDARDEIDMSSTTARSARTQTTGAR